jgi:hypothetical protein
MKFNGLCKFALHLANKVCRAADYQLNNFRVEVATIPSSPDELIKNEPDLQV